MDKNAEPSPGRDARGDGMSGKIMAEGNLDDILRRLNSCHAVLCAIQTGIADPYLSDVVFGACDLLKGIAKDLQADVECAEDYGEGTAEDAAEATKIIYPNSGITVCLAQNAADLMHCLLKIADGEYAFILDMSGKRLRVCPC